MRRHITLGADEFGQVYGLEIDADGTWKRNRFGAPTSCDVIRPITKKNYEYMTKDPESVRELWMDTVAGGLTDEGLCDWFKELVVEDLIDKSFVYELLNDDKNPTVSKHNLSDSIWDKDGQPMSFQRRVALALVESSDVTSVNDEDDVYDWEASGTFAPKKPFAVEFAPKEVLEEYYAHLRETSKEFKG